MGFLASPLLGSDGSVSCMVKKQRVLLRLIKPDSKMRSYLKGLCRLKHATETQGMETMMAGTQDGYVCRLIPGSGAVLSKERGRP